MRRIGWIVAVAGVLFLLTAALSVASRWRRPTAERLNQAALAGDLKEVRRCVEGGVSVDATFTRPWPVGGQEGPALRMAAAQGRLEVVGYLLEKGAAPSDEALLTAVNAGHDEVLALLVKRGADINAAYPKTLWTGLHMAAMAGRGKTVETLLGLGADPARADSSGRTALHVAISVARREPADLLARGVKDRDVFAATALDPPDAVRALLDGHPEWAAAGPPPMAEIPLLHVAVRFGRADVAALLLDRGADVNAVGPAQSGAAHPVLHHASVEGDVEMTRLLLARGAKVPSGLAARLRKVPAKGERAERLRGVAEALEAAERTGAGGKQKGTP